MKICVCLFLTAVAKTSLLCSCLKRSLLQNYILVLLFEHLHHSPNNIPRVEDYPRPSWWNDLLPTQQNHLIHVLTNKSSLNEETIKFFQEEAECCREDAIEFLNWWYLGQGRSSHTTYGSRLTVSQIVTKFCFGS